MKLSRPFPEQSTPHRGEPVDDRGIPLTAGRAELLVDGSDDRFRGLVHDLLAFGGRLREIRDALGGLIGLSGPAYTVMIAIAHLAHENDDAGATAEVGVSAEVSVMSVARHLNVSQPFVTAEVRKLTSAGLVDKVASLTDGRAVSLTVTRQARDLLAQLAPHQRDINDVLFASLDRGAFERLASIVSILVTDADRAVALAAERSIVRHARRYAEGGAA